MHTNGYDQDSEDTKENDGVDQNGEATGAHVPEFDHPRSPRQLNQEPWRQENEENNCYNDGSPVCRHHSACVGWLWESFWCLK